jgi:hypothetical protein
LPIHRDNAGKEALLLGKSDGGLGGPADEDLVGGGVFSLFDQRGSFGGWSATGKSFLLATGGEQHGERRAPEEGEGSEFHT